MYSFPTSAPDEPNLPASRNARCDVFIKFGGSILNDDRSTAALVSHIAALAKLRRIVILPGGGHAVKRIKATHSQYSGDFHTCWRAAVLCIDVNAGMLAAYSKLFTVVSSVGEISACFASGNIAILAPSQAILNSLKLLPDWQPTTDSMGLYFAGQLQAKRYVIISDVHGIYEAKPASETNQPPLPGVTADELERLVSSKLDPLFPSYFRSYPISTFVVNGRYPERVDLAILGEETIGTKILLSRD